MLVVLPTYRRLDQLEWSLRSVFEADVPMSESARLRVISNYPPGHDQVAVLLDTVRESCPRAEAWDVDLIRREKTLDPITNWYSAIAEHSHEGEIVFLHGDDDVMLPWGLIDRWDAMQHIDSSILLTPFISDLVFDGEYCYPPQRLAHEGKNIEKLSFSSSLIGTAPFIGSHCYRFDDGYRNAFQVARQWCGEQKWMEEKNATLFIPLYLPLAALINKTGVAGLDAKCVVRGTELAEIIDAPYACRSWNNAYLYGGVFDILTKYPLGSESSLEGMRDTYIRGAARGWFPLLFDGRLTAEQKWGWAKMVGAKCFSYPLEIICSLRLLLSEKLRLRKLRMNLVLRRRRRILTHEWMNEMRGNTVSR